MAGKFELLDDAPAAQAQAGGPASTFMLLDDGPDDLEGKTLDQYRQDKITWPADEPASLGSALVSGLASDPQTQIRHFASKRFPDQPIDQAMARYGFDKKGDLVFAGDDGRQYRELSQLGGYAQGAGEYAPSIVGAVLGGLAGGGPLGAMGGGAAGEGLRKGAATAFLGEPRDPGADAIDMGLSAVTEGAGWKAAELGGRVINRRTARDIDALTPERRAEAQRLVETGAREGIHVTPAEALDLQSLKGQQTYLSNTFGPPGDKLGRMYKDRNAAVESAVERQLPEAPHLTTAGAEAKPVFGKAMKDAYDARTAAATPAYKAVMRPENVLSDEAFAPIKANPFLAEQLAAIKGSKLHNELAGMPENSLPVLDAVKKRIDGQIQAAKQDPALKWEVSELQRHKNMLVGETGALDKAFPGYKPARAAFAEATPEVKEAERSLEGVISRISDKRLAGVANEVFSATKNTAGPVQVGSARALFHKQGKASEWDNLLNSWLRKEWEAIPDRRGNPASSFYDKIYGSEQKRNIMREAMGPDRYRSFNDLMQVLEATTRVQRGQSVTHFAGEAAKEVSVKASPIASRAGPIKLRDWWVQMKTGRYNEALADIITNPGAMAKLKELRKLAPGSQKALNIAGAVVAGLGLQGTQDWLAPPTYAGSAGAGSNPQAERQAPR